MIYKTKMKTVKNFHTIIYVMSFVLLEIAVWSPTSIKFWKDSSTRGNSPILFIWKIIFRKPVNKGSWRRRNSFNPPNLVNSIGIGPTKNKETELKDYWVIPFQKTWKVVVSRSEVLKINHVTKLSWEWNWLRIWSSYSF